VLQSSTVVSQPFSTPFSQVQPLRHQSAPEFQPCHPLSTICPPVKTHVNFVVNSIGGVLLVDVVVEVVLIFFELKSQTPHVSGHIEVTWLVSSVAQISGVSPSQNDSSEV